MLFVAYRDSGFLAVRTTDLQLPNVASTDLVFDGVIYNVAGNYNPSSGVYTTAINGYYLINVQIYSTAVPDVKVLVNGVWVTQARGNCAGYDCSHDGMIIQKLNAGDTVRVTGAWNFDIKGQPNKMLSYFHIMLLYPA